MDQYEHIRTAHRVYKKSIRQIARETGHTRKTIRKALVGLAPKYRRHEEPVCAVMDTVAGMVEEWLKGDQKEHRKQRHTAHRIYTRLVEEHSFQGAESTVRRWVRERKARLGMNAALAVVPLDAEVAREAEVDWGSAWVVMAGERRLVKFFCMRSRYSGKPFVRAYPWERQEMFFDAHMRAFRFYGGVFSALVFDNLTVAVRKILRGKRRVEQERFTAFRSHYTFEARFCNPAKGQEKGGVEGLVGFARRNFLVPIPEVKDFDELNDLLLRRSLEQGRRQIQGRENPQTIDERHDQERERLLKIPDHAFENSKTLAVRISRYQTAQVDRNRYSAPTAYVGRRLWAHVDCDRVSLYADQKKVADHPRVFGNCKWQIDPQHYLELIRQRIGSFESARPIRQWRTQWPAHYERMLASLRDRKGDSDGTREFVGMLQLHQSYPYARVEGAVAEALECQTYNLDSVKHILVREDHPEVAFSPLYAGLMPGVTDLTVGTSDVGRYDLLLAGGAPC
jgi:transposase